MPTLFTGLAVLYSYASLLAGNAIAGDYNVGFKRVQLNDPMGGSMQLSLWYPTEEATGLLKLGPFSFVAKRNASVASGQRNLVVLSHGTGGSDLGHRNVAIELAKKGLIAAAPLHPRNNFRDDSGAGSPAVMEGRPRQITAIIDQLASGALPNFDITSNHVGGFGFSLGGYTMLSVMGAKPEMDLIWKGCQSYPHDPVCHVVRKMSPSRLTTGDNTDFSDKRLCAAVVVDPLASAFTDESLARIQTKFVQLWKPEIENVLLAEAHIDRVAKTLNNMPVRAPVELVTVAKAQHYSFIAPFPKVIEGEIPKELTNDHPNFDRTVFQEEFAERVSSFLADSLSNCEN